MTDALDRLEAAAVARLREVLAADPAPPAAHPHRLARRALAVAAAVAVAVACVALDLNRAERPSVMVDQSQPVGPGTGVEKLLDAYETLEVDWGPDAGRFPPLVVPTTLPDDAWYYDSGGMSYGSPSEGDIRFDFLQRSAHIQPLPTVTLCVSLSSSCPPSGEGDWQPVALVVPGLEGQALLYGEPDVLDQWADIRWTLDPTEAAW